MRSLRRSSRKLTSTFVPAGVTVTTPLATVKIGGTVVDIDAPPESLDAQTWKAWGLAQGKKLLIPLVVLFVGMVTERLVKVTHRLVKDDKEKAAAVEKAGEN